MDGRLADCRFAAHSALTPSRRSTQKIMQLIRKNCSDATVIADDGEEEE
jgi:hypothetical protein